ncbi:MAG: tetratricopeptide repeat protein [Labilithrix sp.]|nr:tetratricopeptide repeat protein [Labilithrix sp.]
MRRAGLFAALCLGAVLASTPAHAETDEQRAISLFDKGRKLARDGRCADAIAPLLESIRYAEGVGPLLNLGNCYETLGKAASAHRWFMRAQEVAAARDDLVRRREATQRAQAVEKDISTLVVHVPPPMRSPRVEVRVDGEVLPRDRWGAPTPVDPGAHRIEVIAPPDATRTASVTVGDKGDRVEWSAGESSPAGASTPEPARAPAAALAPVPEANREARGADVGSGSPTQRTLGLVTGGVGLGGLAAGAIFGVISISAHSSVVGACPSYPVCSSKDRVALDDMNGRAETTGTISTIGVVAGAILLAGGAALFFTAPPTRAER